MDSEVIKVLLIGIGVIIPISITLFNRYMKNNDDKFSVIFKRLDELKVFCDALNGTVTELKTDMSWIKSKKENGE